MKKVLGMALILCMVFASGVLASQGITLIVNGQKANVDVKVINGVTYLPLRAVGDLLNVPVVWDGKTNTVTVGTGSGSGGEQPAAASEEGIYRVDKITFLDVQTKEGMFGWEASCEVRNNDSKDYKSIIFKATYYDSAGTRLGTATGIVNDLKKGDTRTVNMITTDNLSGFTKIKFQVDTAF